MVSVGENEGIHLVRGGGLTSESYGVLYQEPFSWRPNLSTVRREIGDSDPLGNMPRTRNMFCTSETYVGPPRKQVLPRVAAYFMDLRQIVMSKHDVSEHRCGCGVLVAIFKMLENADLPSELHYSLRGNTVFWTNLGDVEHF